MSDLLKSSTLNVSIACPPAIVYEFVSNPENLPNWATAFCKSVRRSADGWLAETPDGPMKIEFVSRNPFGVLDHRVNPSPNVEILVPMRVIPNGSGSEVLFTLLQYPSMSDERFATDCDWVKRDLQTLKTILEA